MSERRRGIVDRFGGHGFGFITDGESGEKGGIFVHQNDLIMEGYRCLYEGEEVEYGVITQEDGRLKAIEVKLVGSINEQRIDYQQPRPRGHTKPVGRYDDRRSDRRSDAPRRDRSDRRDPQRFVPMAVFRALLDQHNCLSSAFEELISVLSHEGDEGSIITDTEAKTIFSKMKKVKVNDEDEYDDYTESKDDVVSASV
jgi:cold shock CspA family protein